MKTNGIVRKVDGLGRIVIPREFRKLYKISPEDPMEISCLDGGEIVLRKIDMTLTLCELALPALDELRRAAGGTVLLSNTCRWVGGSGELAPEYSDKELPRSVKERLSERRPFDENGLHVVPVAGDADVFGALYACGPEHPAVLRAVAAVLGTAMQKF